MARELLYYSEGQGHLAIKATGSQLLEDVWALE